MNDRSCPVNSIIIWKEIDGAPVTPPRHKGFGSRLIERALAEQLGGTVSLNYHPSGVICMIEAPLSLVNRAQRAD